MGIFSEPVQPITVQGVDQSGNPVTLTLNEDGTSLVSDVDVMDLLRNILRELKLHSLLLQEGFATSSGIDSIDEETNY